MRRGGYGEGGGGGGGGGGRGEVGGWGGGGKPTTANACLKRVIGLMDMLS